MPNIMNQELVRAFNIILCHNELAITNLIVQSTDQTFLKKEDRIVISFDKNMDVGQCMKYLHNIKKSIVETFCGSESGANMSFNTQFFPFNLNERQLTKDKEGYKFSVPIDKGVVFNLKCLLAHGLAKDAKEDMGNEFGERCMEGRVYDVRFDRKSYLYCMRFYDKKLQDYFVESFSSRIKNYKNGPKSTNDFLKIKDNCVYIKGSIFNKAKFIKDIVKHKASLECRDFEVTSAEDETVESLKFPVIDLSRKVGIPINSVLHVSYTGSGENSVLIPAAKEIIDNIIYYKILSKEQADDINKVFGMTVLNNVEDCISPKHLPVFGRRGIYGIDFANQDISYCVLNKIMESSVINKDHELSIDPGLRFQALSPAQSPLNSPTHAGPSGLRTPPNQRDRDSGYDSNSPPKPKDSGSSSGGPSSRLTELSLPTQEFPKRSRDKGLERLPRQGSEREEETEPFLGGLGEEIGQASTSSQQTDMPSSSYTYIDKRDESMPEDSYFLPSTLTSFPRVITPPVHYTISTKPILLTTKNDQKSSSLEFSARSPCLKDVNILGMKSEEHDKSEQGACSQVGVRALEGDQADDESMLIKIQGQQVSYRPSLTPFPTAWDDSTFLNLEVSNEESEKQQVTDKSDRKSSDEGSKAKPQKNESSKKHGGGLQSKIKSFFSLSPQPKQHNASLKRHDEGRGTTHSTPETPVTKKSSVSRLFSSLSDIVRAENNSPSKETSPVSSLDGDPGPSQGTISGKGEVLPVEYRSDNSSSKTAVDRDSGFCSTGSPAAQHKGSFPSKESVPSEVKECEVEPVSEALRK